MSIPPSSIQACFSRSICLPNACGSMGRKGPASREDSPLPTLPRFLQFLLLSRGLVGAGGQLSAHNG